MAQAASHPRVRAQDLERELEDSIACLWQMGSILETYRGPQDEACYFDKINEVVEHYGRLYAMRGAVTGEVPMKVMEDYLDKELNPDLYTKHRLEEAKQLIQVRAACMCLRSKAVRPDGSCADANKPSIGSRAHPVPCELFLHWLRLYGSATRQK
jgi:hypothetical protein